jgi:hypothetical protein
MISLPSRIVEEEPVEKRLAMTVHITAKARAIIDGIKEETGIAKQEAVGRFVEWFADQPRSVRREMLTKGGNAGAELMRLRMSEMMAAGQADPATIKTVEDALKVIRLMTERIEQIELARQRQFGKSK